MASALGLQLALPAGVLASQSWTATADPSSVSTAGSTTVSVDDDQYVQLGWLRLVHRVRPDPGADPDSSSVQRLFRTSRPGHSWSISSSGLGPTTVTARAATNADALSGDPDYEQIVVAITVTGVVPGSYSWTANELNSHNCAADFGQPVSLPMTVVLAPTPTPAPTATPTPTPRRLPRPRRRCRRRRPTQPPRRPRLPRRA